MSMKHGLGFRKENAYEDKGHRACSKWTLSKSCTNESRGQTCLDYAKCRQLWIRSMQLIFCKDSER